MTITIIMDSQKKKKKVILLLVVVVVEPVASRNLSQALLLRVYVAAGADLINMYR